MAALAGFVAEVIEKMALALVSTVAKILRLCIVSSLNGFGSNIIRENSTRPEVHSITSSALASSDCGIVSPSALAVFRLITISYLVAA